MPELRRSIAVIGCGPAGLMAADVAASAGHDVTIYERMPSPARKFLMAGRGGLNITHSEPLPVFLARYGHGSERVAAAVEKFPATNLIDFVHALGEETFVGSSGRVFPKCMKASPLLRAWLKRLAALGVKLKTRHTWLGFGPSGEHRMRDDNGQEFAISTDAVIFALGGASWPKLGSDGAWVAPFQDAGIPVTPLAPSNCGVTVSWSGIFASRFEGAPLKRLAVTVGNATARGEAIVTRTGLEGGVIYALARPIREALAETGAVELTIDLKPDSTAAEIATRLASARKGDTRANVLRKSVGLDAAAIGLLREAPLPQSPDAMAGRIKAAPVHVTGLAGMARAISTAGGIDWAGIDRNLMLSDRPGCFVAGEMLDWDAPTGGYLLQATFATGAAAAIGAQRWLAESADTAKI